MFRALRAVAHSFLLIAVARPLLTLRSQLLLTDASGLRLRHASTALPGHAVNAGVRGLAVASLATVMGVACACQIGRCRCPELVSLPAAILVFGLTLHRCVNLLAPTAFAGRIGDLFEAARTPPVKRTQWWHALPDAHCTTPFRNNRDQQPT